MGKRKVTTAAFTVSVEQGGVVRVVWAPGVAVTAALARESDSAIHALSTVKKPAILVDMRRCRSIDAEARAFYAGPEVLPSAAIALLTDSPATRFMAQLFMRISRPSNPTSIHTSEQEALAWLRTMIT